MSPRLCGQHVGDPRARRTPSSPRSSSTSACRPSPSSRGAPTARSSPGRCSRSSSSPSRAAPCPASTPSSPRAPRPKLVEKEKQTRFLGYGGMLMESFVAIMALVARSRSTAASTSR
ncbi:carbon starvation CstA family protein [Georgenia sp. SUBG003]|uniref:carbon starvation CstA family protein n=1 Tax=Georgenia sp. SUBG003 TaxID=1497974 RepID=UPI003AB86B68